MTCWLWEIIKYLNVSSQCKEQCLPNHPISQNNAFIGLATLVLVRGPVI